MPHISIKTLAYDNGETLLNYTLTPIKSRSWLTKISCASYENLISCNVQEKELKNSITSANDMRYGKLSHTQQYAQDFLEEIYKHCVKKGVFKNGVGYVFTVLLLQGGVLRVLALEEENAHCDVIVPILFLPFCLEAKPSGVFLLHNWLMFYHNGELLYDVYCDDIKTLKEGLAFLEKMYAKKKPQIQYLGGFVDEISRQQQFDNSSNLDTHLEIQTLFASADFQKINSTIEKLCFDFVLQDDLQGRLQQNLQEAMQNNADKSCLRPKPIYYQAGNALLQTQSFWAGLKAIACCAMVCILPFCKLGYAKYAQSKTASLKAQNEISLQATKQENTKTAPKRIETIDSTLQSLLALHLPYVPRIEIISSISAIASKNAVWIGNLSIQSPSSEEAHTKHIGLDLGVYANDEKHIEVFLQELRNASFIAFVDSGEMVQKDDIFMMNISANL